MEIVTKTLSGLLENLSHTVGERFRRPIPKVGAHIPTAFVDVDPTPTIPRKLGDSTPDQLVHGFDRGTGTEMHFLPEDLNTIPILDRDPRSAKGVVLPYAPAGQQDPVAKAAVKFYEKPTVDFMSFLADSDGKPSAFHAPWSGRPFVIASHGPGPDAGVAVGHIVATVVKNDGSVVGVEIPPESAVGVIAAIIKRHQLPPDTDIVLTGCNLASDEVPPWIYKKWQDAFLQADISNPVWAATGIVTHLNVGRTEAGLVPAFHVRRDIGSPIPPWRNLNPQPS